MKIRRPFFVVLLAGGTVGMIPTACDAQCCLSDLFAGCRKAPAAYAAAPVPAARPKFRLNPLAPPFVMPGT